MTTESLKDILEQCEKMYGVSVCKGKEYVNLKKQGKRLFTYVQTAVQKDFSMSNDGTVMLYLIKRWFNEGGKTRAVKIGMYSFSGDAETTKRRFYNV